MSQFPTNKLGAWLMACGLALGGAAGNALAGEKAARPPNPVSVKPDTVINASAVRPQNAAGPGTSAKSSRPGKPARTAKPRAGTPGKMQVAEPRTADGPAADRDSKDWQLSHAKGLTLAQRQAFRERKDKMREMMALIKEKRMAMRDAEPEKRAVLARELHKLILEEEGVASAAAARTAPEPRESEAAAEKGRGGGPRINQGESRQLQLEKRKEEMRNEEIRKQQLERIRQIRENKPGSDREGGKKE